MKFQVWPKNENCFTRLIFLYKPKVSACGFRIFPTLNTLIMKFITVVIYFQRSHNFSRKSGSIGGIPTQMKGFAIESCLLCGVKLTFENAIKLSTGGRDKVQSKFRRYTIFFRKFTVVPYKHPLFEKLSKPCTL